MHDGIFVLGRFLAGFRQQYAGLHRGGRTLYRLLEKVDCESLVVDSQGHRAAHQQRLEIAGIARQDGDAEPFGLLQVAPLEMRLGQTQVVLDAGLSLRRSFG
ncbi:hypothetical protein ABMA32_16115 [Mesorhizobium sp. VNQ89]